VHATLNDKERKLLLNKNFFMKLGVSITINGKNIKKPLKKKGEAKFAK
jgi:hypothetical protein